MVAQRPESALSQFSLASQQSAKAEAQNVKLHEEIRSLKLRLQAAESGKATLERQLVPVDKVKGQLKKEQNQHSKTQEKLGLVEKQCRQLDHAVADLEAKLKDARADATLYQGRCLELESACAELGQKERLAKVDLFMAQEREQAAEVSFVTKNIALGEAENHQLQALSQLRERDRQFTSLRSEAEALGERFAAAQEELHAGRTDLTSLQARHAALEAHCSQLQKSFDVQQDALRAAFADNEGLHIRMAQLEAVVETANDAKDKVHAVASTPAATAQGCIALHPERLAIQLAARGFSQGASEGPGSAPALRSPRAPRSAMADRELPGLAQHVQREIASIKSRREYPRCAASKQMRGRILTRDVAAPLFDELAAL